MLHTVQCVAEIQYHPFQGKQQNNSLGTRTAQLKPASQPGMRLPMQRLLQGRVEGGAAPAHALTPSCLFPSPHNSSESSSSCLPSVQRKKASVVLPQVTSRCICAATDQRNPRCLTSVSRWQKSPKLQGIQKQSQQFPCPKGSSPELGLEALMGNESIRRTLPQPHLHPRHLSTCVCPQLMEHTKMRGHWPGTRTVASQEQVVFAGCKGPGMAVRSRGWKRQTALPGTGLERFWYKVFLGSRGLASPRHTAGSQLLE
jgi:hypothetical protein